MKMNKMLSTAALAAAMAFPCWTFAQAQSGSGASGSGMAGRTAAGQSEQGQQSQQNKDQRFVEDAANDNLFEVAAGRMAQERASNPQVKEFAQRLIQDHEQAQQQLQQAAQAANVQVPSQMDQLHQLKLEKLGQRQGEDFEKDFVYDNVGGHMCDVLKFRDAEKDLQNAQLRQYAQQTLPHLRMHLREAERLAGMNEATPAGAHMRGTGGASGSTGSESDMNRGTGGTGGTGAGAGTSGGGTAGSASPSGTNGTGAGTPGQR